jgi:type IV pilus assembly protein PilQ
MTFSSWSLVAAAVLSLGTSAPAPSPEPTTGEVRAMSLVAAAGRAEFVVEIQGAVSVKDFTLEDPARVVVDLTGATLPEGFKGGYDGANRGGVIGMRIRQYSENVVRVVLVLDRLKPYTVAQTEQGINVSFGAEQPFAAWRTGQPAAQVVAAAPETRTAPAPVVVEPTEPAPAAEEPSVKPAEDRTLVAVSPVQQRQEPRLTVSWDNASIQEVIAGFQAISGRSIILGKAINVQVSAEIRDKPWPDAFKAVLGAYGLSAQEVEGGIIRVDAPETLAAIDSLEPRQTDVLKVNYANAGELANTVAGVVSKRGKVIADTATNSLIITETRGSLPAIMDFARGLDIRPPQIAIQAKIIFVDRTDVEQLGFRYDLASANQFYNRIIQRPNPDEDNQPYLPGVNIVDLGGNAISAIANADAFVASSALDLTYSIALGGFSLTSFLTALERIDLTDVQTEPVITTKDNKRASLLVGEEIPIRIIDASSTGGGAGQLPRATVQFKEVGIKLNVTPHVTNNRQIVLNIETERSAVKVLSAADLGFSIDKQNTKNEILVNDGETAVIGGLTVTTVTRAKTGIPLLSSLPILGGLFSFTSNTENRKDLIILVTPRIVDDAGQDN